MGEELEMLEIETETQTETETKKMGDGSALSSVVRWERFLPRKVLRVLLVEADDSTRQIITALLKKCSYKVAAVSDGLKAWEVLKGRSHNIDLILTEVELPSISGFALLTLIMEHESCKNIPVIMMSCHDSVSTVYKCMLRGAADFLVKPLRKNELKNLWQHVWRRQASTVVGHGPQDESDAQQKVEATAENNANSNHSSGYMACIQRNRECIEKGSDAQSSCTKPDLEAEGVNMEHMQDLSQPKWNKSLSSDVEQKQEECVKASEQLLMHDCEGSAAAASKNDNTLTWGEDMAPESRWECANINTEACDNNRWECANINTEACDNNHVLVNCSREAIDLIGAFDSYPECSYRSSGLNYGTNKVESSPLLDLSLRRAHPSGSVNQFTDGGQMLKQSDASAFSRYVNRTSQPLQSTSASICYQQKDYETNSDKQVSNQALEYNSDTYGTTGTSQKNLLSLTSSQQERGEIQFPCRQQKVFPVPVPVRGIRFESLCTYGSALPPIFCTQSGMSPMQSPGSSGYQAPSFQVNPFCPSNPETRNSQQFHDLMDQNVNNASDQTEHKQGHKLDSFENQGHFSFATDQSASSSFCNGPLRHLNSIGSGNNGNPNLVPVVKAASECANETTLIPDGNSHRSIHREAALTKFRMKRKDRCYEKKVRYESRKKLAEQRPRVKGQFVRHVHTEPPSVETDSYCGNSSAG